MTVLLKTDSPWWVVDSIFKLDDSGLKVGEELWVDDNAFKVGENAVKYPAIRGGLTTVLSK